MKTLIKLLLFSSFIFCNKGFSQEIEFQKNNFADSISISKNIPNLAKKVIEVYKEENLGTFNDNLFRLKLVAKEYKTITSLLRETCQASYNDSIANRGVGFAYRVYANAMSNNPTSSDDFVLKFKNQFYKLYNTLDEKNQVVAEMYYDKNSNELREALLEKIKSVEGKEKISIDEAISICRAYCSYITFSSTLKAAKEILNVIANEKYIIDENIILTMKDGGTIAVTLVRNRKIETPQPVVFMSNIYAGSDLSACKEMVTRGFVGVIANTRGKRLSQSVIEPFEHDSDDIYEVIDWISKQNWCNGKVGMFGGSYLGFAQWSATKKMHPALKTIVPQVAVGIGIDYPMQNGVFMSYMLSWIHFVTNNKLIDLNEFNDDRWEKLYENYFKTGAAFRDLDKLDGRPNEIFQRWLNHPTYDEYWQKMTPQKEEFAKINIPILTITGYYDDDQLGAMYYYKEYLKWNKQNNNYLLIGPYDHFGAQGFPLAALNDYKIDEVANIPIQDIVFDWFNYTLKDGKKPEILKDKVNFQLMGANSWKHVPSLEKMYDRKLVLYIDKDNKNGEYHLKNQKNKSVIKQTIDFKIRDDMPKYSKTSYCGFDLFQPEKLPEQPNMLVFESETLQEPLSITGAPIANVEFSCNKKDVDITFQLYEKTPDGKYFALSNNLARASLTKDKTKRNLLTPGKKETIILENNFMACKQLQKGSKIVILLGINKSQSWQINYGTGKDVSDETIKDAEIPLEIEWTGNTNFVIPIASGK
ncbi:MAG TPA: CocE/NonD family hydrolase [Flavobacterium lutivivi]|nr:CocE/NonD family hydrolase [Flavobacterium lutivivi]